jgi:3-oxo-5-alpha-steroid 4-dehydrogenase 1
MDEFQIFQLLMVSFGFSSILFFLVLLRITAGYGQHVNRKWGTSINDKLGWVLMEIPTVIVFLVYYFIGEHNTGLIYQIFLFIWMLHYCQRTFIFPLLIRGKHPMPLVIIFLGITFNGINTYLQARWLYHFSPPYTESWLLSPLFIAGIFIFFSGFVINLHSDYIIRNLRKPGETDFKIPYGGMFKYVSSPSYFGEITEWVGWAIMTWSVPGLIFAMWTFANLAPRARSNHMWYIKTFSDYPDNRKALIPFIF